MLTSGRIVLQTSLSRQPDYSCFGEILIYVFLVAMLVVAQTNSASTACIRISALHAQQLVRRICSAWLAGWPRPCEVYLRFRYSKLFSACVPVLAPRLGESPRFSRDLRV